MLIGLVFHVLFVVSTLHLTLVSSQTSPTSDCNWAGIACENWQIVMLSVPCTSQPSGYPGDCALQTKVGGFPLNALAHVTSLRAIDLDGNALAGTLPAAYATSLQQLTVLLVGSNQLTGSLPASWSNLTSMAVADFGNNNLAGQLPGSWGRWAKLQGLRVTANFLKGPLPVDYGEWTIIEQLQLGQNMFTGTVPGSWSSMLRLQDLELDYNCGLCGTLPSFSLQGTGQLSIDTGHCSIGRSCGRNNCSSSSANTVIKAVLGSAAVCIVVAILLLRQWQVRRWNAMGYDTSATIEMRCVNRLRRCCGLAPIVPLQRSSSSRRTRRSRDAEASAPQTPRRRRQKQPQPTLVIMPDGRGLCFAVRLPDGTSAKDSMPGRQQSQNTGSTAEQQQSVVVNVPDQQQHHFHDSSAEPVGGTGTSGAGSVLQHPGTADVELGDMAKHDEITLPGQPEQRSL